MKQRLLMLCVLLCLMMAGCTKSAVLEENRIYEVKNRIHSLDIQIGAADFQVEYADEFRVESNLKYLSVSEKDGVLTVVDEKTVGVVYDEPVLILYIPEGTVFDRISMETGAAQLTADSLTTQSLRLQVGAGDVTIGSLTVQSDGHITGGAGKIAIGGGTIHNLTMEMGVGALKLRAALVGDHELTFGVGEAALTLLGSKADYSLSVEKGIGTITVDGESAADFGSGANTVTINGGIGSVNLTFAPGD